VGVLHVEALGAARKGAGHEDKERGGLRRIETLGIVHGQTKVRAARTRCDERRAQS
jgi:hypothetical protein